MLVRNTFVTRTRVLAAAIALSATATGCGVFSVDEPGDSAAVTITGDGTVPLRLVLSNNFIQVFNSQSSEVTVSLLGSDTVEINDLPYSVNYGMGGNLRFFLRLINPDTIETNVRIQVRIDNVEPYDVTTSLTASQHEYTYTAF
jgi:hypothetical protein